MMFPFNMQSYLDNLTFLSLFIAMLSYWTSISFTSLKFGSKIGFISIFVANLTIFIIHKLIIDLKLYLYYVISI